MRCCLYFGLFDGVMFVLWCACCVLRCSCFVCVLVVFYYCNLIYKINNMFLFLIFIASDKRPTMNHDIDFPIAFETRVRDLEVEHFVIGKPRLQKSGRALHVRDCDLNRTVAVATDLHPNRLP
jgi:hypothetical protein